MSKVYSEKELKEIANGTFAEFPNAKKAYATTDGNVFLEENRARLHAGAKGTVVPFDRPIETEETGKADAPAKPAKAEDQIKAIGEATTLEELEKFKSDTRATVVKALEAKTAELTPAE